MTDQEKLAELLGKEGYQFHGYDLSKSPIQEIRRPRPARELLAIAENRWRGDKRKAKWIHISVCKSHSWAKWADASPAPHLAYEQGETEQEARMKCAIAGLQKLKEKNDGQEG